MTRQVSRIQQGSWHAADCKLCGGKVAEDKVEFYGAIRTLPNQDCLEEETPILEDIRVRRIRVGTLTSSFVRFYRTFPGLYLFHRRCYAMIRHAAKCEEPKVSLLTLVSILAPTTPVDEARFEPLSNLDGDSLATTFNLTIQPEGRLSSPSSAFRELLHSTPPEILLLILSKCPAEYALAVTVGLADSYFNKVIRDDLARQRITVGIQAARLLQDQAHNEVYTERYIELSSRMTAIFVSLGGEIYLQDIKATDSHRKPSVHCVDFSLNGGPQVLALQVDHLGIRNIAFELGRDNQPKWLRDENRLANMFLDRLTTGTFSCLRIISDPIKIRMIDIATPDRINNPHPRALLPRCLSTGVPYSVHTVCVPYLLFEGYFKPSYIQFSTCNSVFLSQKHNVDPSTFFAGIGGVFDKSGEGREEVSLGSMKELRALRLFGLERLSSLGGNGAFLQIQTDDGCFLPLLPDMNDYKILDKQEYTGVKGVWWGASALDFYFNVVY
ncbi:hypothetical protein PtrSN002B_010388 [Pyrenophora tritici-repentis]|nr:hypothetical protein PtrSN002B_010388 [Pyrenophora tritici-repentis]